MANDDLRFEYCPDALAWMQGLQLVSQPLLATHVKAHTAWRLYHRHNSTSLIVFYMPGDIDPETDEIMPDCWACTFMPVLAGATYIASQDKDYCPELVGKIELIRASAIEQDRNEMPHDLYRIHVLVEVNEDDTFPRQFEPKTLDDLIIHYPPDSLGQRAWDYWRSFATPATKKAIRKRMSALWFPGAEKLSDSHLLIRQNPAKWREMVERLRT